MSRGTPRFAAVALVATLALGVGFEAPVSGHGRAAHSAAATSSKGARSDLLRLLNQARHAHHLRPVKLHLKVSDVALHHSRQMARRKHVSSSRNLPRAIHKWLHGGWGENVTCGTSAWTIHRAFLHDKDARSNMLRARFRFVGIGVARTASRPRVCRGGGLWVTEILFE